MTDFTTTRQYMSLELVCSLAFLTLSLAACGNETSGTVAANFEPTATAEPGQAPEPTATSLPAPVPAKPTSVPTPTAAPTVTPEPTPERSPDELRAAALTDFESMYAEVVAAGGLAFYEFAAEHSWPRGAWTAADIRCNFIENADVFDAGSADYAYRNMTLIERTPDWAPSDAGQPGGGEAAGAGTFLVSLTYLGNSGTAHVHFDDDLHVSLFTSEACREFISRAEAVAVFEVAEWSTVIDLREGVMTLSGVESGPAYYELTNGRVALLRDETWTIVAECAPGEFKLLMSLNDPCGEILDRDLRAALSQMVDELVVCSTAGNCRTADYGARELFGASAATDSGPTDLAAGSIFEKIPSEPGTQKFGVCLLAQIIVAGDLESALESGVERCAEEAIMEVCGGSLGDFTECESPVLKGITSWVGSPEFEAFLIDATS